MNGDLQATQALLDSGANPSVVLRHPDWGAKTDALNVALECKKPLVAQLLVDRGADVGFQAGDETVNVATKAVTLSWRRLNSDEEEQAAQALVPKLLAKGSKPSPDCLVTAAAVGDLKMLRLLLQHDLGDEPHKASDKETGKRAIDAALASAVDNGQEKSATELLQAGANPDSQVPMKGPCINVAVANSHVPITKALIAAKANLNGRATVSIGTFQEARVAGGERRGDLIIHTPAVARDATPLIIAIRQENLKMVQLLVESGADVDATDGDGLSPLAWSIRSKFKAAEECLRSRGAAESGMEGSPVHQLYNAAASGDAEKAQEALASGADVNALVERRGVSYTPLMRAARAGHSDLIQLLLAAGADPNLAGRENIGTNITPLMLAARQGHKGVVELLLQAGARVDIRIGSVFGHRGGQNAIQQAKDKGHSDVVKLLRKVTTRKNSKPNETLSKRCN